MWLQRYESHFTTKKRGDDFINKNHPPVISLIGWSCTYFFKKKLTLYSTIGISFSHYTLR